MAVEGTDGLGWAGLDQRGIPPHQRREVVQIVANFFVTKIDEKSIKIVENCKKAPQSATKRSQLSLAQLLGRLEPLLGCSWAAPGCPERGQERQNSSPKPNFRVFLNVNFRINFCIDCLKIFYRFFEAPTLKNSNFP